MPSTSRFCPLPANMLTVICAGLWTFLAQYDASILLSANVLIIGLAGLILSLLQCCCKRTGRQYGHIDRIKTVIERYIHCLVHEKSRLGSNVICIAVIDGCGIIKSLGRNPDGEELQLSVNFFFLVSVLKLSGHPVHFRGLNRSEFIG